MKAVAPTLRSIFPQHPGRWLLSRVSFYVLMALIAAGGFFIFAPLFGGEAHLVPVPTTAPDPPFSSAPAPMLQPGSSPPVLNPAGEELLIAKLSHPGVDANLAAPTSAYDTRRHYSALDQIDVSNVNKINVVWTFSTGVLQGHHGTPPVSGLAYGDGKIFLQAADNTLVALAAETGKLIWTFSPGALVSGIAYADGKIFLHQANYILLALDVKKGEPVWLKHTQDEQHLVNTNGPDTLATGAEAPMVVKDKVYVGESGEFGVRPWLSAYSVADGKQLWRSYIVPPGPDYQVAAVPEKPIGAGSGGPKNSYSYDPKGNLIYYDEWSPGDKWPGTTAALDPDTGHLRQYFSYNSFYEKNGVLMSSDRSSGNITVERTGYTGEVTNKNKPNIQDVCLDERAFSPTTRLFYGLTSSCIPPGNSKMGDFVALDTRAGKIAWWLPEQVSIVLATEGGVVFFSTLEGYLKAVDAYTGKELYRFKAPSGVVENVMTYEHSGKQYIAVLSGVGRSEGNVLAGQTDPHVDLAKPVPNNTSLGGTLTVLALP